MSSAKQMDRESRQKVQERLTELCLGHPDVPTQQIVRLYNQQYGPPNTSWGTAEKVRKETTRASQSSPSGQRLPDLMGLAEAVRRCGGPENAAHLLRIAQDFGTGIDVADFLSAMTGSDASKSAPVIGPGHGSSSNGRR